MNPLPYGFITCSILYSEFSIKSTKFVIRAEDKLNTQPLKWQSKVICYYKGNCYYINQGVNTLVRAVCY